jgi:hypothetical protein
VCEPPLQARDLFAIRLELLLARTAPAEFLTAADVDRDLAKHVLDLGPRPGPDLARKHLE